MVQSHDPPSPESGRDIRYYEHVMKDSHEHYESDRITPSFSNISCMKTSALPITTTPAPAH
jgi:hypothetical protein